MKIKTSNKDLNKMIEEAQLRGWILEKTNRNHIKWVLPGKGVTFCSYSPSDWREPLNLRARIRRIEAGLPMTTGRTITKSSSSCC